MKIAIGSDLHLEFGVPVDVPDCDVMLLAGDILNLSASNHEVYDEFFNATRDKHITVYYVLGNHEYYYEDIHNAKQKLRNYLPDNFHVVDNNWVDLGPVLLFGSTFWTDFNMFDPMAVHIAKRGMNDFRVVKDLTPDLAYSINKYARQNLATVLSQDRDVWVMTHHMPLFEHVAPRYKHDILSFSFANTGLADLIMDSDNLKVWISGHTHDRYDIDQFGTRFISNPRGYVSPRGTENPTPFEWKILEI